MKILLTTMSFGPTGGMRVISELANHWVFNNEVDILCAYSSSPYFPLNNKVGVIEFNERKNSSSRRAFKRYIKKYINEYDVIIATYWITSYLIWNSIGREACKKKGFYYIQAYEAEFFSFFKIKEFWKKILAAFSYSLPFRQIVNSDLYCDYKGIHSDRIVPPGIDLEIYYPKDLEYFNKKIKIGTIGRFEDWKGTKDICKAMESLKDKDLCFDFYIAFNDFDTCEHIFVKPDGDKNLADFYRDMDIVVVACKGQLGSVHYPIIESMAVGTTVICTDYYPSNDNNSYKININSPDEIERTVIKIINNKQEAICKRKQALTDVNKLNWNIVSDKFLEYISRQD